MLMGAALAFMGSLHPGLGGLLLRCLVLVDGFQRSCFAVDGFQRSCFGPLPS